MKKSHYKFIEQAPKRSKPLHNFSMPADLKWGKQWSLRCMKVDSDGKIVSSPDLKHHHHHSVDVSQVQSSEKRSSPPSSSSKKKNKKNSLIRRLPPLQHQQQPKTIGGGGGGDDDEIEEIKAKLRFHLRTVAQKMNFEIPKESDEEEEEEEEDEEEEEEEELTPLVEAAAAEKPWNLRKRRAACNAPTENGKIGSGFSRNEESKQNSLPLRTETTMKSKSLRLRGSILDQSREKERRKFSIPLSRKEIDEDFMAMLGTKPSRRPTKRPKIVQKQVDAIFPGLWLSEVTVDAYRVPDLVEPGKR